MNRLGSTVAAIALSVMLAACATATGAAVGAGIGSLSGNAGKGAAIGGAVGAVVDIVESVDVRKANQLCWLCEERRTCTHIAGRWDCDKCREVQ